MYLGVQSIICFNLVTSDISISASPVRLGLYTILILLLENEFVKKLTFSKWKRLNKKKKIQYVKKIKEEYDQEITRSNQKLEQKLQK